MTADTGPLHSGAAAAPGTEGWARRLGAGEPPPVATEPVTVVIFGGAGDLAHRKFLPAVYNRHLDGLLPPRIAIVGAGRKALTDEQFRDFAKDGIQRFSRRS